MKKMKLVCFALLLVSIRQVNGKKDYYDYYSGFYSYYSTGEEEADKNCEEYQYKCGDMCVGKFSTCNCGNVLSSISIGFHKTTAIINCDTKIVFTQIVSTDFVFSTTRGAHSSFCSLRCSYYLLLDLLGPPSPSNS